MTTETTRRRAAAPALVAALALTLAACAGSGGSGTAASPEQTGATGDGMPEVPAGLETYYSQELAWADCEAVDAQCATVTVPLDYAEPDGETIELSVMRAAALEPDGAIGPLFVNPGGPGGPASQMVEQAAYFFTPELREDYDIVALDPRGVGESTPVTCFSAPELDTALAASYDTSTPEGVDAYLAEAQRIADQCAQNSGVDLLAHISTAEAARDFDVVRHLLEAPTFDYLGFSYGTFLGAMYADLFPQNVGRMVLDGGMDPTLTNAEVVAGQAQGFEAELRAWAEDCLTGTNCPFTGTPDEVVAQVGDLLEAVNDTPLPSASGRSVTGSLATMGVITPLYSQATWDYLTQALTQAVRQRDGSTLLLLADLSSGRQEDGTYRSNSSEALWAVNCADYPVNGDRADWDAEAQQLAQDAPVFGPALAYSEGMCAAWPQEAQAAGPVEPLTADGAPPIVVIGTTGDPATPYAWSRSLADQLSSGVLVTFEGHGHTAYSTLAPACVRDAVDDYLLEGTVPEDGLTC